MIPSRRKSHRSAVQALALVAVLAAVGGFGGWARAASDAPEGAPLDYPGMDFSSLSPGARRELGTVLSDEFCYCGCPHSIGQCLKGHASCNHAKRAARLAASLAQAQMPASEITAQLSTYYQSFAEPRHPVKIDARMCRGPKDAPVTVVEYSDFECPYCGASRPALETFTKEHADKVRFCYAPFPLTGHPHGYPAAEVALFARDHGKFWPMHDLLFQNQTRLGPETFSKLAAQLGLSSAQLTKAMDAKKYDAELSAWRESGRAVGLEATPSIYFNGRKYTLAVKQELLGHALEDELEWSSHHNAWAAD